MYHCVSPSLPPCSEGAEEKPADAAAARPGWRESLHTPAALHRASALGQVKPTPEHPPRRVDGQPIAIQQLLRRGVTPTTATPTLAKHGWLQ